MNVADYRMRIIVSDYYQSFQPLFFPQNVQKRYYLTFPAPQGVIPNSSYTLCNNTLQPRRKYTGLYFQQHIVCYFHTANVAFISNNKLPSYEEDNSKTRFIV